MTNQNFPNCPVQTVDYPEDSLIGRALSSGSAMVVGGGYTACNLVNELSTAAERAGEHIRIIWVAEEWMGSIASYVSGGWHFPFLNDDPRIPQWARASYRNHPVLSRLGLTEYLGETTSVILTRRDDFTMPAGAPGPARRVNPTQYGTTFYKHGYEFTSTVLNMTQALPAMQAGLGRLPGVHRSTHRFEDLAAIIAMARRENISVVAVAAGSGASELLGHQDVDGDLGMLLLAPTRTIPLALRNKVLMDEDRNDELCYLIPKPSSGITAFGGSSGWRFTDEEMRRENGFRHTLAREIRDRLIERMPALSTTLADDAHYRIVWGYRPTGASVIMRWLPEEVTDGVRIMEVGALSGSGVTVGPAFVADAARLSSYEDLVGPHS